MSFAEDLTTSGSTRLDDEDDPASAGPGRQCVLYYTNKNARYAADFDSAQSTAATLPFTGGDPEDYDEEDDDDEDDDDYDGDNDDVEADDYIAVDEQGGAAARGSVIKLEDAAFVGCSADGDFEVDRAHHCGADDGLGDVAESFFDGGGGAGFPVFAGGRRRMLGSSLQHLVGSDGRRSILDGCCWYGPVTSRCLASCIRSRPFLFFIYVVLALTLLSSLVSLVLVGSLVARPYVRASEFINASCSPSVVSEGSRNGQVAMQTCSCGKGCNSKYRCIRIHVRYTSNLGAEKTAVMYDDETTLGRQCSFYPPCRSSRAENEDAVSRYQSKYGLPGSDYPCWYNPHQPTQVIQHHRFHLHHVVNGVAGSAAVLLASLVLLVCVVRHRRYFKIE